VATVGDVLVEQGTLSPEQLREAETRQASSGATLVQALVELRLVTEAQIFAALAATFGMTSAEVDGGSVDPHAAMLLPAERARELVALPVRFGEGDEVVVAVADPSDQPATAARLQDEIGLPVRLALAPRHALVEAIEARVADEAATSGGVGGADAAGAAEVAEPKRVPLHALSAPAAAEPAEVAGDGAPGAAPPAPPSPATPSTATDAFPSSAPTATSTAPETLPGLRPADGNGAPRPVVVRETDVPRHVGPTVMSEEESSIDLDELLVTLVDRGGSDLHLTVGIPPAIRVHGEITPLDGFPVCVADDLRKMLYAIMTQKQREQFENELELDMSYSIPGKARFRVNVFQQRDALGAVMRVIPFEILPLEDLGIPGQVANFAYLPRGFVLVTGPTGSGKSTTLASVIDLVNRNRASHIMTVEDPIEFLHNHKRSIVNQREVGTDTHGFNQALKHVLRQDPDVILIGEMRDLETIQIALTAAETGHLVFGTLHTQDAPQSVDRIIDVFPPHQQEQIRVMLAGALQGVVCQTLLKTADGQGRTAAVAIMTATSAVRNLIREGKTHQLYSAIQAGAQHGMVAMDQSLATLVKQGRVSYDAALEKANNVNEFNRLAGRA
jgi:twitching motility protein PilT